MKPVKIAIAGGGYGSKVALPVYAELDEFEPVAIWSRRAERARELAREADLRLGTDDLDELLAAPGLEAIHVATPVVTHAAFATAAAARGLHVMCEKPVGENLADARRIVGAIEAAGVVGAVNYGRRMQDTRRRLIELAREVAGAPRMVTIALTHSDHQAADSRPFTWVNDARLGGGRLQGYGVHDLDLVLELYPIEAVAAATEVGVPMRADGAGGERRVTAEDAYAILLRFRGGGLGVVSLVSTARHATGEALEIYGDAGTVRVDVDRRIWWGRAGEELRCEGPVSASSSDAFKRVARSFYASIRDGAPPDPSLDEGLRVQAVYDAVRVAEVERRWVVPAPVA